MKDRMNEMEGMEGIEGMQGKNRNIVISLCTSNKYLSWFVFLRVMIAIFITQLFQTIPKFKLVVSNYWLKTKL